ncbi:MAG: radical SAM protein [Candidatus Humimicrobiaceae bacterium]
MKVVYEPAGKAREYSPLALNLYNGCRNGCLYCYVPNVCKKDKSQFHSKVEVRQDILKKLELDCISSIKEKVLICFTSDPYPENSQVTREALKIFNEYNVNFQILTKNPSRASRDFDLYKEGDCFAVTLTFINEADSLEWEPKADLPYERLEGLQKAKEAGIETWVSLEPVIDPEQSLKLIDLSYEFVDLFKVGKINNYKGLDKTIDWRKFGFEAIEKLKRYNKRYYIKKDLQQFLN